LGQVLVIRSWLQSTGLLLARVISGGKLKMLRSVLPVLAAALAIAPLAKADSYTYTISGSNFNATFYLTALANDANGMGVAGTDTITSVAGSFTVGGKTYNINTPIAPVAADAGADATHPTNNGSFLYDNLLYPNPKQANGILDWDGLLITVPNTGGYQLNLFSGAFGGIPGNEAPGDMYFYFADNGSNHSNNIIPEAVSSPGSPASASLVATPEPASLLLMGSGLLALACVLFRKRRSSGVVAHA
jgi:hypothetical protein